MPGLGSVALVTALVAGPAFVLALGAWWVDRVCARQIEAARRSLERSEES